MSTISIIDSNKKFTPLRFYTEFLEKLSEFYKTHRSKKIIFKLFENGDEKIHESYYRIDPITLPLLLSIIEQLSKFHKEPLNVLLYNNAATINVLEFLYKSDFFKTAGNANEHNTTGKNIINIDERYFGDFKGIKIRRDHLVRSYSIKEFKVSREPNSYIEEMKLRDYILSTTTYKIYNHFKELLFENESTLNNHNLYIDILSELVTNGILHSGSTTYAMMFVDKYKTKFSISDNGIGLKESLDKKKDLSFYYTKNEFQESIYQTLKPSILIDSFKPIFETLFYSSLKERRGLFDLMLIVVIKSNGYFRLHTDNCQIIASNRIFDQLQKLHKYREEIFNNHMSFELKKIENEIYRNTTLKLKEMIKELFLELFKDIIEYYSEDTRYSSLRFFNVRFRGVHIEVEIPNI
ncbi:hypothetical protein P1X15_10030 [Runella sp. MFBS21]|uniref:hypothetical protein n=1 Tax=Runella sp. MFBS21 TaxID=3034018 RepID=UPI0023F84FDD|nr:hypothetical protein [Runella sp. MFBS21]MDF7817936.1 hypothetical protein [Runella sp. MFBS21]